MSDDAAQLGQAQDEVGVGQGEAEAAPPQEEAAVPPAAVAPPKSATQRQIEAAKAGDENALRAVTMQVINDIAVKYGVDHYKIVMLFDDLDSISDFHSDQIYRSISGGTGQQDILLLVQSRGGKIEPAYLISKTCKKIAHQRFVVAVPRKAKSAATLIALGADEIHLGMMSQLGPIDPQVNDYPALGLANGLTKITSLVTSYPQSAEMWAKYLSENLSLRHLGYLERLGESCAQYAERLLQNKVLPEGKTPRILADHFVNHYKDHSFLIDIDEATTLLGTGIIRSGTPEYGFANEVYAEYTFLEFILRFFLKKEMYIVGDLSPDSITIRNKSDK